ncbi:MAG TPA: FAD-binding protein, partial [Chromatiaceae bacterium]|nr:FAD-binding protein [Chromatiaceae bacterium]
MKQRLISALKGIIAGDSLLTTTEQMRPYECDGLSAYRELPMAIALPKSIDQVKAILKTCCDLDIPVVARGAGTGLSAGALPLSNGLLLSL